MSELHPWARGPFELILHAESHLVKGNDFDRRMALISYDQALEVSISTYLALHPSQRGGVTYAKADVDGWLYNYHTKLDFLSAELASRELGWQVPKEHIIWAHDHRGEQYHGGRKGTPETDTLSIIRQAVLWVFSFLYDVPDVEGALTGLMLIDAPAPGPQPDPAFDREIDGVYGMVAVADQLYSTSEILFAVDHAAYRDLGASLCGEETAEETVAAEVEV